MSAIRRRPRQARRPVFSLEPCEARVLMATGPPLGMAAGFAVLGGSTVTNTGATQIVGNVGVSPGTSITGFPPGVVSQGAIQAGGPAATQAEADLATAYNFLAGEAADTILSGQDLGGKTLAPGVYRFSSGALMSGALTFDAQGNPDAVFVIQVATTLTTGTNSSVALINGARASNVYWQVGSSATLGTGTMFQGDILAHTSITLVGGASISPGRALAITGAVTMDTNAVSDPAILGKVYRDDNASGSPDPGEPGIAGRVVFADLDHNGRLDPADPTATTDGNGNFTLNGPVPGTVSVFEATALDAYDRLVVAQTRSNADGTLSIGVVPISPIAPVPVVPSPFTSSPSPDPRAAYVHSLYLAVLGRAGTDFEASGWLTRMDLGETRQQVAFAFVNSPEHRQNQVQAYYEEFLHRSSDPTAPWVGQLMAGVSEEEVVNRILGSNEYQTAHPSQDQYVRGLYLDVLGRQSDPAGLASWDAALASGMSRQDVATAFLRSPEASGRIVDSFYTGYLHRQSDPAGANTWMTILKSPSGSATDVAAAILGSSEFYQDASTLHS